MQSRHGAGIQEKFEDHNLLPRLVAGVFIA